jgi:hypothetical protein
MSASLHFMYDVSCATRNKALTKIKIQLYWTHDPNNNYLLHAARLAFVAPQSFRPILTTETANVTGGICFKNIRFGNPFSCKTTQTTTKFTEPTSTSLRHFFKRTWTPLRDTTTADSSPSVVRDTPQCDVIAQTFGLRAPHITPKSVSRRLHRNPIQSHDTHYSFGAPFRGAPGT